MIKLIVGDSYQLRHGIGVLMGKEVFNSEGHAAPLETKDMKGNEFTRYIFTIDANCKWADIMETTKYAAWGEQIQEIK